MSMTTTPPAVRIVPLNLDEFPGCENANDVQQKFFSDELPSREGGCFRYKRRGLEAEPGTIVLFQCEGSIIASAVFSHAQRFKQPDRDGYEGGLYFDVTSIRVFDPVSAGDLKAIWPSFEGFGQVKQALDPARYPAFEKHLKTSHSASGGNSWITTQWPPRVDSGDNMHSCVYLPDGRETAGSRISPGDMVFIYESGSGRTLVRTHADGTKERVPCKQGRQGIVTVAKVLTPVTATDDEPEHYADGSTLWWRWMAETEEEVSSGFVAAAEVKRVLGYDAGYNFHGFGDLHSGVKQLAPEQCEALLAMFRSSQPPVVAPPKGTRPGHPTPGGGEGPEHEALKKYLAAQPSLVLREAGVRTVAVEYEFPCGDRADIVLADNMNRPMGVEVEVEQNDTEWAGLLQAIKYRHMLAVMHGRPFRETRALLVAHRLGKKIKDLCHQYEVQSVEVGREDVARWQRQTQGSARTGSCKP